MWSTISTIYRCTLKNLSNTWHLSWKYHVRQKALQKFKELRQILDYGQKYKHYSPIQNSVYNLSLNHFESPASNFGATRNRQIA